MIERTVAPFRPLRYRAERVGDLGAVWAPPYDVISASAAAELRARQPYNIVRITNPEGSEATRYRGAARTLDSWVAEGVLARDVEPTVILHRHRFMLDAQLHARSGVWALLRAEPLGEGLILPHERTLSGPKADRLALWRACRTQLSPIFVIASDPRGGLERVLAELAAGVADAEAEFPAGEHHEIWQLDASRFERFATELADQNFLIADGHHRYETYLALRDGLAETGRAPPGKFTPDFVLAYVVSERDPGLLLLPTHRLIGGESRDWVGAALRATRRFEVVRLEAADVNGVDEILADEAGRPTFVLVAQDKPGGWLLRLRKPKASEAVAAVALHDVFLPEVVELAKEGQLAQMTYVKDAREAVREVRTGATQAAALLAPPRVSQIREIARAGQRLPAKTTYFWPKVPTGVALHVIDPPEEVGAVGG